METRLKEKVETQRKFLRTKADVNLTVSICVTLTISPLGSLTYIWAIEVMVVRKLRE